MNSKYCIPNVFRIVDDHRVVEKLYIAVFDYHAFTSEFPL